MTYPPKNRGLAIVLAFFLGGLGLHRFYVGRIRSGFLYILFCWTFVPAILGLLQAILWALNDERRWQERYATR